MIDKQRDPLSELMTFREKMDRILDDLFPERMQARGFLAPDWPPIADIQKQESHNPEAEID
jgi:hypothetical protein